MLPQKYPYIGCQATAKISFGKEKRLIFKILPEAAREKAEGRREAAEGEKLVRPHDLYQTTYEDFYNHEKNFDENLEKLARAAMKGKFRSEYLPYLREAFRKNDQVLRYLPKRGEKAEAHHVHKYGFYEAQIRFFDRDGKEILDAAVDVSDMLLQRDALAERYGLSEYTRWRLEQRRRELAKLGQKTSGRSLQALIIAAAGLPGGGYKAPRSAPTKPIDPEEVRALERLKEDIDSFAKQRGEVVESFALSIKETEDKALQQKRDLGWGFGHIVDGISSLWRNGYDIELRVDPAIADFSDDDWSAEGKWKFVEGRREVENLLSEDPVQAKTLPYSEFLKSKAPLLTRIAPAVRDWLTGNLEEDLQKFRGHKKIIERCEADPRLQGEEHYGNIWNHRAEILNLLDVLETYAKDQKERAYATNPFRVHGWSGNIDHVRRAVQEDDNGTIRFDHVAELLYSDNFEKIREGLKLANVPEIILSKLEGDDIEEDFMKLRDIRKTVRGILDKDPKTQERILKEAKEEIREYYKHFDRIEFAYRLLSDYIVYSVRLVRAIEKLRYAGEPAALSAEAYQREGGNIFAFNRHGDGTLGDNPAMARSKAALTAVFYEGIDHPTRYYTLGEKFWKWISGNDPSERFISMRDFNGDMYSVDRRWFFGIDNRGEFMTRELSSDTAYRLVYEAGRKPGTPEAKMDEKKIQDTLKHFLQLGIAAYRMNPDEHFPDLLKRNDVTFKGMRQEAFAELLTKLSLKLKSFFSNLEDFQKTNPNFDSEAFSEFLEEERDRGVLSDDLLNFIRLGAVISEKNQTIEQERREMPRVKITLSEKDAAAIVTALKQADDKRAAEAAARGETYEALTEAELGEIREGLTAGVIVTNNNAGLGVNLPLPHGYSIALGAGIKDWSTFAFGGGVGKELPLTENFSLTIYAGAAGTMKGVMPALSMVGRYNFQAVSAYAVAAGTPLGFYAGVGVERRADVLRKETVDRKYLESHITGPEGLDRYSPEGRYHQVSQHPEIYPEFMEMIHTLETYGFEEPSRIVIFETYYQLFKKELAIQGTAESFPIFRGVGIGGTISINPLGLLEFLFPFKFGMAHKTLVFRIADTEGIETLTSSRVREELVKLHKAAKEKIDTKKTIRLRGDIQVDEMGNLTLSKIDGGYLELNPFKGETEFRNNLEAQADIAVLQATKEGLIPLHLRGAYGEIHVNIDPDMRDDVLVVTDRNQLYLSVNRSARVYVTREDITYPFPREGVTERTYLTISGNPYVNRRGPGGIEQRSPLFMSKMPGYQWQKLENRLFSGATGSPQVLTLAEYQARFENPNFAKDRLRPDLAKEWKKGMGTLMKEVTRGSFGYESPKLPENFEKSLAALKADNNFMKGFRDRMTAGFDFETEKANPDWSHNLHILYDYIKRGLAEQGVPPEWLDPAKARSESVRSSVAFALERALTELVIQSFQNLWGKKNPEKAFNVYLEQFEHPLLLSIFTSYFQEKGMDAEKAAAKAKEVADYLVRQMKGIIQYRVGQKQGEPMKAGTFFAILAGLSGMKDKHVTGIRTLYHPHESADTFGVFYPSNNEYAVDAKSPVRTEIARFWIEHFSPMPNMDESGAFTGLLELVRPELGDGVPRQKLHDVLRSPLCLKLAPYSGTFLNGKELKELSVAYAGGRTLRPDERRGVEKFLKFCWKVRKAQLAGTKEIKIAGTDFFLVIDQKIIMGVYAECGNLTAAYRGDFMLRDERKEGRFLVARRDGVTVTDLGNASVHFGIFFAPGFVAPDIDFGGGEGAEETPGTPPPEKPHQPSPLPPGEPPIIHPERL